MLAFVNWKP